jgi:V/A-type H+-transporting ATPase subunit I
MPWRDDLVPRRMARVAVVAPETRWRRVLAEVADAGVVEPDRVEGPMDRSATPVAAEFAAVMAASAARDSIRAVAGWAPTAAVSALADRLAPLGGTIVELPRPAGQDPPTLLADQGAANPARPLVDTYATVPYRDVDPTWFAAAAYVVMFGMMFGDVGDGILVAAAGLWLRRSRQARFASVRRVWPLIVALGLSATAFGVLYGECFGPTGVVSPLWLRPLDEPTRLLGAGIAVGAFLLAAAYGIGVVNRWREGGVALALYAPTGIAGAALFVGLALVAGGVLWDRTWMWATGVLLGLGALVLVAIGLKAAAGSGVAGGLQASVELVDVVIRLGSNVVSFARLAAFGLTHAALGKVVWDATAGLWGAQPSAAGAVVVFIVGHVVAFALEALVAGVQALRLEYYELFSRIFASEGRPFRPWHVPLASSEESP